MPRFVTVEIVKVPQGEAPESIKKEWVGIRMRAMRVENVSGAQGVLSGRLVERQGASYAVRCRDAVQALRDAGKEEAAKFWNNLPHLNPEDRLLFHADECKEITVV